MSYKLLAKALQSASKCENLGSLCARKCLQYIVTPEVKNSRYKVWTKTFEDRVQWFYDKLSESKLSDGHLYFTVEGGNKACGKCFMKLHYLDKNFYYTYLRKFKEGSLASNIRKGRDRSVCYEDALQWLVDYSNCHADRMPDKKDVLLPYKTRKIRIYELYLEENTNEMKTSLSRSAFMEMWMDTLPHLKIKKVKCFRYHKLRR